MDWQALQKEVGVVSKCLMFRIGAPALSIGEILGRILVSSLVSFHGRKAKVNENKLETCYN